MERPKNPYQKGSMIFKIMDGDWSGYTVKQAAEELGITGNHLRGAISKIKKDTGYEVPMLKPYRPYVKVKHSDISIDIDFMRWKPCYICDVKSCNTCKAYFEHKQENQRCKICDLYSLSEYEACNFCHYCGRPLNKYSEDGYISNLCDYIDLYKPGEDKGDV